MESLGYGAGRQFAVPIHGFRNASKTLVPNACRSVLSCSPMHDWLASKGGRRRTGRTLMQPSGWQTDTARSVVCGIPRAASASPRDSLGNSPLHLASRKPLRLRRLSPLLVRSHPPHSPPSLFLRCLLQCLLRCLLRCLLQTMLGATPVAAACAHDLYYE